jgi:penicillin-binding protein 1A
MDAGIAFLITNVLQEAIDRGTGTAVRTSGFEATAAGKTGTTNDATDTWFVGYTPRLVAAVWMGFDEPRPIMGLATGGRLAAPVWGRMMTRAPESLTTTSTWPVPSTVLQTWIDPSSGLPLSEGCRPYDGDALRELFLRAAMPKAVCPDRGEVTLADAYPAPSDEDQARDSDPWPEDMRSGSHPAPPPEYEEAETWRRAREQAREDAERAWREARKEYERQLKEWRKEQKRRRRDREE